MRKTLLAFALLAALQARGDTAYNNTAYVNSAIGPFGHSGTSTYGETFLAPATDTVLDSFSLFLNAGITGQVQGYIVSWTGSGVASILYSSNLLTLTGAPQEFDFNTSGLSLVAGGSYAAILSIVGPEYYSDSGTANMPGVRNNSTIPGGSFIYQNDSIVPAQFTVLPWTNYGSNFEAEFTAGFTSNSPDPPGEAPEPGSLTLFGTGLAALIAAARRRLFLTAP